MTDQWFSESLQSVLRGMSGRSPKKLITRLLPDAEDAGIELNVMQLAELLDGLSDDDLGLRELGLALSKWDCTPAEENWTQESPPSTPSRRALVHKLLGTTGQVSEVVDRLRPVHQRHDVVVSTKFSPWYSAERATERSFYWPRYERYLLEQKKWSGETVGELDAICADVVRRLADPVAESTYQSKGLVVGYVQSGKTANFTGVIAKAIDAGYRLVIVMTGTIELLRSQTQRRIDMELVGQQNIVGSMTPEEATEARIDYQDDVDWLNGRFLDLGTPEGKPRITRLTTRNQDYTQQFLSLTPERIHFDKPMWHVTNLHPSGARLVVTKKNHILLGKLVADIKHNRDTFKELPVLIIDDESDQASINTVNPTTVKKAHAEGKEIQGRKAINRHIAEMLELMPRAQYVGYTATPFANVFVDPADDAGIFPKDFVIGLAPPSGYMGAEDFSDLDGTVDPPTFAQSNIKAHVRDLEAADDDVDAQIAELRDAVRMYVLTGAVKLYRAASHADLDFRHHTMLVHESVRMADARDLRAEIIKVWRSEAYSQPRALTELRKLYETDVKPVMDARAEKRFLPAPAFDELKDHLGDAVGRMTGKEGHPVIVVNSDKDIQDQQETLDFDRHDTWRILVGGTKLSRGFTVAGLTVTYFRRATNLGAALTQMGRWFGFREGYRDLTRIYIARKTQFGKKEIDLLEAFEGIARDERAFRAQLAQYAGYNGDGTPSLTPLQIPPLVYQHLNWLMPDAKNKMFNARLKRRGGNPLALNGLSRGCGRKSLQVWTKAFDAAAANGDAKRIMGARKSFLARIGTLSAPDVVDAVEKSPLTEATRENLVEPALAFFRELIREELLGDFLVLAPQPDTALKPYFHCGQAFQVVERKIRHDRGVFGEITDPNHRQSLEDFVRPGQEVDAALAGLQRPDRGAMVLYVMCEKNIEEQFAGVQLYIPEPLLRHSAGVLTFAVRVPQRPDSPTVDSTGSVH